MTRFAKISAAAAIVLAAGTISASAACDGDASTETVLGAGSGALVGGLASHSIVGAAVGGVAGGLIGNSIGHSNNRADCRRAARARATHHERDAYYVDRYGRRHYY
jgi:outer membrane lipoprotein SlyB